MIKHDQYAGLAAEKHVYKQPIFAERGTILDANNEVLAHNVPVETVVADATHLTDVEATVDLVSGELKLPRADVSEKLHSDRRYIALKREIAKTISDSLRQKLRAKNLRGMYFKQEATRNNTNDVILWHVIVQTHF